VIINILESWAMEINLEAETFALKNQLGSQEQA